MNLIDDAIGVAQIQHRRGHQMIEGQGHILYHHKALRHRVQRTVRHRHRLSGPAGGTGGVNDECGFVCLLPGVPHRTPAEGSQQGLHTDRPIERLHGGVFNLLSRRHHRHGGSARHRHVQEDHMTKPQLLAPDKKLPDQIRLGQVIRNDEVRQLLLEDGLLDPFSVKGRPGSHQGNLRSHHVEAIECKDDL